MTCKECIHERVCDALIKSGCPYLDEEIPAEAFCLEFRNTTDVVPKSEVEETVRKVVDATDKVICETKAKVAREIFEEIEKIIEASEYEVFDDFGDTIAKCHNAQMLIDDFAELKKKYIGGNDGTN
jgi:hypothetical protein